MIIRVASVRSKRYRKCSYAYEARGIQGEVVLWGAANSTAKTKYGALQEAMVESVIKAMQHGFHTLLFLTTCRRLSQVLGQVTKPDLFEMTMLADISHLQQNGLIFKMYIVPRIVLAHVFFCC